MKKELLLCAALSAMLLLCGGLCLLIYLLATSEALWQQLLEAHAPFASTGLPESEIPGMAALLAAFLQGKTEAFQYIFASEDGSTWYQCFQAHEQAHMADCRGLIQLSGVLGAVLLPAGLLLLILLLRCAKRQWAARAIQQSAPSTAPSSFSSLRRGFRGGLLLLTFLLLLLALWALLDFDGFFYSFHLIAFRNDGWLLDPQTDLLIRLMPQALFQDVGLRGLLWGLGWLMCLWFFSFTLKERLLSCPKFGREVHP